MHEKTERERKFRSFRSFCKGELRSQSGFQQVRGTRGKRAKRAIAFRFCDRISENSKNLERSRVLLLAESEQLRFNFAIVFLKTQKFGTKNEQNENGLLLAEEKRRSSMNFVHPDFIPTC